jgi:glycosyltransferase involved in cell wall biosynthesis
MKANRILYCGVMSGENGFTKAMRTVCDEFVQCKAGELINQSADLVFLQTQDDSKPIDALKKLKQSGSFIINWSGDARHQTPPCYFEYAKYIDLSAFSNGFDIDNLRKAGYKSEFLQIGYDPEIYYPDPTIQKDIQVVFMGNHFGHFPLSQLRRDMVNELKRTYGSRFKAYGFGMPDGTFMGDQKGEADIYRRSKIGINLSHFDYPRYTSDRMFRMLGSGICVLTHAYHNITDDFDPRYVVYWRDIAELKDRINKWLSANEARKITSNDGHELAINNYTFSHMAQNIIKLWQK